MVGRSKEIEELNRICQKDEAQFIAIYGRRRVGKTYLINEAFNNRITFRHTGLSPIELKDLNGKSTTSKQLEHFYNSLRSQGANISKKPKDWFEAFFMLEMHLQSIDDGSEQIVFIDELPWLDTPKSLFTTSLEAFWNGWASSRHNFRLIVCGSAISWMQDKLINNHGGLYGRLTYQIKLQPFTLKECEEFLISNRINYSRYDIVQTYMITGGIPYYLGYIQSDLSLAQNIDNLFFIKEGKLKEEFNRLFSSIFTSPNITKEIVKLLSKNNIGLKRNEIAEKIKCSNGGNLTKILDALVSSDFAIKYIPFGQSKKEFYYKLTDPFCLFYLKFVYNQDSLNENFWINKANTQSVVSWRGFAFENVCFNHIKQIKEALGISGVYTTQSAWAYKDDKNKGTQIDLLIERSDNIVNLCEIKFYGDTFTISKDYDLNLAHKQNVLQEKLLKRQSVHNILITTYGITDNQYKYRFDKVITLDDLFNS